ncbi:hypothetical protein [Enterovibrio baiacu]|uniref:hypothetical protein n=1 Tax=Enterovibrio baiacu TaxID=2491023 RepID=UPI0010116AB5|nr:hypothetical protein [Enterovibrio baiacu]MBE1273762.1 hypothetical protein [Enterovibrio baiacu]
MLYYNITCRYTCDVMLLLFRRGLPLILVVLLGWQGLLVAEHKGSHHHELKTDAHCTICVLGSPAVLGHDLPTPVTWLVESGESTFLVSLPLIVSITAKARSPPRNLLNVI